MLPKPASSIATPSAGNASSSAPASTRHVALGVRRSIRSARVNVCSTMPAASIVPSSAARPLPPRPPTMRGENVNAAKRQLQRRLLRQWRDRLHRPRACGRPLAAARRKHRRRRPARRRDASSRIATEPLSRPARKTLRGTAKKRSMRPSCVWRSTRRRSRCRCRRRFAPLRRPDASRQRREVAPNRAQPSASTRTSASDRLSPEPRARWRALPTSISVASRGGSACTMAPSSRGVK